MTGIEPISVQIGGYSRARKVGLRQSAILQPPLRPMIGQTRLHHIAQVALRPGANVQAVAHRLDTAAAAIKGGQALQFHPPAPPQAVQLIKDVAALPLLLGAFLALLAVGAVGHALAIAVCRRQHELAVLRALGMTQRRARAVVATQASVLAVTGLKSFREVGLEQMWQPPSGLHFDSFRQAFEALDGNLANSFRMVIPATVISCLLGSINGYVLTKWRFRGSDTLFFLLLFGIRWLAKAVARQAGLKAMHDEDEEFAETREALARGDRHAAWLIAFKGVFLEGLEVWLIVVALGMKGHHASVAVAAALLALLVVAGVGMLVRKPLRRVPENAIKFGVGSMITAFGTFWTIEATGGALRGERDGSTGRCAWLTTAEAERLGRLGRLGRLALRLARDRSDRATTPPPPPR